MTQRWALKDRDPGGDLRGVAGKGDIRGSNEGLGVRRGPFGPARIIDEAGGIGEAEGQGRDVSGQGSVNSAAQVPPNEK